MSSGDKALVIAESLKLQSDSDVYTLNVYRVSMLTFAN